LAGALPFWRDHLLTLAGTGLRAGELCGLSARRVDLDAGILYVVEARYDAGKGGHGIKSSPKSQAGIRPIPMAEQVAEAIRRSLPELHTTETLVFAGPGGGPGARRGTRTVLTRYQLRRVYLHAVSRAREQGRLKDLDLRGPHDLRHTFATWLEDAGIPSRVIDEVMGHAAGRGRDGSAIGPVYRHTTAEMRARLTAAIGERLTSALKIASDLLPVAER
jgi:integrase